MKTLKTKRIMNFKRQIRKAIDDGFQPIDGETKALQALDLNVSTESVYNFIANHIGYVIQHFSTVEPSVRRTSLSRAEHEALVKAIHDCLQSSKVYNDDTGVDEIEEKQAGGLIMYYLMDKHFELQPSDEEREQELEKAMEIGKRLQELVLSGMTTSEALKKL